MKIIRDHFEEKGLRRIPTREAGVKLLTLIGMFDGTVKMFIPRLGVHVNFKNDKSKSMLGMKYNRNLETTFVEMVQGMLDHGIIEYDKPTFMENNRAYIITALAVACVGAAVY